MTHRIFGMTFASIHRLYAAKVERKGRTREELDAVLRWLTGYDQAGLDGACADERTLGEFLAKAPAPTDAEITGSICGVKLADLDGPMLAMRRMDKVVDELARGRSVASVVARGRVPRGSGSGDRRGDPVS